MKLKLWEKVLISICFLLFVTSLSLYVKRISLYETFFSKTFKTQKKVGIVHTKKGTLRRQSTGENFFQDITQKSELFDGDLIVTQSNTHAQLDLLDDIKIEMQENSMLQISFLQKTEIGSVIQIPKIEFLSGQLIAESKKTPLLIKKNSGTISLKPKLSLQLNIKNTPEELKLAKESLHENAKVIQNAFEYKKSLLTQVIEKILPPLLPAPPKEIVYTPTQNQRTTAPLAFIQPSSIPIPLPTPTPIKISPLPLTDKPTPPTAYKSLSSVKKSTRHRHFTPPQPPPVLPQAQTAPALVPKEPIEPLPTPSPSASHRLLSNNEMSFITPQLIKQAPLIDIKPFRSYGQRGLASQAVNYAIQILSPQNQKLFQNSKVLFEWEGVPNAEYYKITIINLKTKKRVQKKIFTTRFSFTVDQSGEFEWHIKAFLENKVIGISKKYYFSYRAS